MMYKYVLLTVSVMYRIMCKCITYCVQMHASQYIHPSFSIYSGKLIRVNGVLFFLTRDSRLTDKISYYKGVIVYFNGEVTHGEKITVRLPEDKILEESTITIVKQPTRSDKDKGVIEELQAQVTTQQATITELQAQVTTQQATITELQAQIAVLKAQLQEKTTQSRREAMKALLTTETAYVPSTAK